MKFLVTTTIALVAFASACDAQQLCGDAAADTPAPTPTGTPTMTTAAPVTTTTAPPTTAPATTSVPPSPPTAKFFIQSSTNVKILDDVKYGVCYALACWSSSDVMEWDPLGPAGTTVNFFIGGECEEGTLAPQQPGDVHGLVLSPEVRLYRSFLILPTNEVPTSESITKTQPLCIQK